MGMVGNGGNSEPPKLGQGFSSLHHTTRRLLGLKKHTVPTPEHFRIYLENMVKNASDDVAHNQNQIDGVMKHFNTLHQAYRKYENEEILINRIERKAQIRNTAFRFLSTLVIGLAIISIYALAGHLDITMPLLPIRM